MASRASPGKSGHCQPRTMNSSTAVTISSAHPIGGAKVAKAPMRSEMPAMTKASASRFFETLENLEDDGSALAVCLPGSEGADIWNLPAGSRGYLTRPTTKSSNAASLILLCENRPQTFDLGKEIDCV